VAGADVMDVRIRLSENCGLSSGKDGNYKSCAFCFTSLLNFRI